MSGGGERDGDGTLMVQLSLSKLYVLIHFCCDGEHLQSFPAEQTQMAANSSQASPAEELTAFYGLAVESALDNTLQ